MSQKSSYQNYVTDEQFLSDYNSYQAKYAANIRESDKVMLAILRDVIAKYEKKDKPLRLLDVGCSTGNLLLHLKYHFPELDLTGGDLAIVVIARQRLGHHQVGVNGVIEVVLVL